MKKKQFKTIVYVVIIISIGIIGYLVYANNRITNKVPKSSKLVKNHSRVLMERRI